MITRAMRMALADGLFVGFVRVLLGIVCGVVLVTALRGGTVLVGVIMGLCCVSTLACIVGLRDALALLFGPDLLVRHLHPTPSLARRAMLLACGLGAAWLFWASFTAGVSQYGGLLAFLPLAASIIQRLWRSDRLRVYYARQGWHRRNITPP